MISTPGHNKLITPVLFVIFNRPDTTQRVFNQIRKAGPARLYVAADGPRDNIEGEAVKCSAARDIIKKVDWDCEVKTLFRNENVGCKIGVSSAIDWLFDNEDEGIILEDDCVPSLSFFWFCQELLEQYRDNERIMHISGDNFHFGIKRGNASYYFSKYGLVWGWATWKRAWKHFDPQLKTFKQFKKENQIVNVFRTKKEREYYVNIYQAIYDGKITSAWDYQWQYSRITQSGLSIHPNDNLVKYIGYGTEATHTFGADSRIKNNDAKEIEFPLVHPNFILVNEDADHFLFKHVIKRSFLRKIKNRFNILYHAYR